MITKGYLDHAVIAAHLKLRHSRESGISCHSGLESNEIPGQARNDKVWCGYDNTYGVVSCGQIVTVAELTCIS